MLKNFMKLLIILQFLVVLGVFLCLLDFFKQKTPGKAGVSKKYMFINLCYFFWGFIY